MGWKMTKEAALKRQKAERLFEEGFGPLKVSRELEVNFYIVRNQGNTPLNRTIASSLFSFGYGYRTVGKMLNLSSIWLSRDWARQHRKLSIVQARKIKRSKK